VTGGRVRLQQVVVNLISNALDAMDGRAVKEIEIAVTEDGDGTGTCAITVRDRGPGLSEAALSEQAFDPFFTTKDPGKGLGLGLSISYNIIRDFDGTMSVANHPEGGAAFTVTLRKGRAPEPDAGRSRAERRNDAPTAPDRAPFFSSMTRPTCARPRPRRCRWRRSTCSCAHRAAEALPHL
jgi:anti-sigma regulatory factor (Ser/Thr protein kinase)